MLFILCRPGPANGTFLSSHNVTPSQAHIFLLFSNKPEDLAIIPQAILKKKKKCLIMNQTQDYFSEKIMMKIKNIYFSPLFPSISDVFILVFPQSSSFSVMPTDRPIMLDTFINLSLK